MKTAPGQRETSTETVCYFTSMMRLLYKMGSSQANFHIPVIERRTKVAEISNSAQQYLSGMIFCRDERSFCNDESE